MDGLETLPPYYSTWLAGGGNERREKRTRGRCPPHPFTNTLLVASLRPPLRRAGPARSPPSCFWSQRYSNILTQARNLRPTWTDTPAPRGRP